MEKSLHDFTEWTPRQVIVATLIVVGILVGFFLIYWFRFVIFALFTAILLSTAIRPATEWLQRRGIPKSVSTIVIFIVVIAVLGGVLFGMVPLFSESAVKVGQTIRQYYTNIRTSFAESPSAIIRRVAYTLPWSFTPSVPQQTPAGQNADQAFQQALAFLGQIVNFFLILAAVVLLTFFWTLERERALRSVLLFFPTGSRQPIQDFFFEMEKSVGAYLGGVVIMCGSIGLLAAIAYVIIGLPNPIFLGILAGLFEAVPMIGPILGAIPAVIVALTFEPNKVLWVVAATVVIQLAENHLLVPMVMKHATGVNSLVTLLALAAFGSLFGLAGALLAIPLAVVIQMIVQRLVLTPEPPTVVTSDGRDYTSKLRYEAQQLVLDIRKQVRDKEDELTGATDDVEESVEVIANDLDAILASLPPISEKEVNR